MPTYQYRCADCRTELEVVQKFTDPPLTDCPECEGTLRKVYSAVGVVFKGSGFYATDNRPKPAHDAPAKSTGDKAGTGASGAGGSSDASSAGASDKADTGTSAGSASKPKETRPTTSSAPSPAAKAAS